MLSGFWNSAAVWSVCLRASGFEVFSCIWHCSWRIVSAFSQEITSTCDVVLVLQVLMLWQTYRKFVLSQYLSFAAYLPCGFHFWSLPLSHLKRYFSVSLCLTHSCFSLSFSHSFTLSCTCTLFTFPLWTFLSSSLLVIILVWISFSFFLVLTILSALSLSQISLSPLCYCSGWWTGECYWRGERKRVSVRRDEMKGCNKNLFIWDGKRVSESSLYMNNGHADCIPL